MGRLSHHIPTCSVPFPLAAPAHCFPLSASRTPRPISCPPTPMLLSLIDLILALAIARAPFIQNFSVVLIQGFLSKNKIIVFLFLHISVCIYSKCGNLGSFLPKVPFIHLYHFIYLAIHIYNSFIHLFPSALLSFRKHFQALL